MNKFLLWLDGKKTKLAGAFWLFQEYIVPIWFTDGMPVVLDKTLQTIAAILISVGLADSFRKGMKK